jgi:hypothetical protein
VGVARFFLFLMRTGQSSAAVEGKSAAFELCAREEFVGALSVEEGALRVRGVLGRFGIGDDRQELAGSRPLRVVPPLRGLRSLAMLAQRLRAGLVYGAALRLGWLSLRRVRFFRREVRCDRWRCLPSAYALG